MKELIVLVMLLGMLALGIANWAYDGRLLGAEQPQADPR